MDFFDVTRKDLLTLRFIWNPEHLRELKEQKFIVFGSGSRAKSAYDEYFGDVSEQIKYVVDNDPKKEGEKFFGVPIYSPEVLVSEDKNIGIVVLAISSIEITSQLFGLGFTRFYYYDAPGVNSKQKNDFYRNTPFFNQGTLYNRIDGTKYGRKYLDIHTKSYEMDIEYEIRRHLRYCDYMNDMVEYFYSDEFNKLNIEDSEYNVFSQNGEDGTILWILNRIKPEHKTFVEFGARDFMRANTRLLYLKYGYSGLLIEGLKENIDYINTDYELKTPNLGELKAVCEFIKKDNINEIFANNGMTGEIALLSIDIDGNDYWVWEAIKTVSPKVVVIEINAALGGDKCAFTIPYNENFAWDKDWYCGASVKALDILAEKKGYIRLYVNYINAIYIRKDLAYKFKDVNPSVTHNRTFNEICRVFEGVNGNKYSYFGYHLSKSKNKNGLVYNVETERYQNLSLGDIF